MQRSKKQTAEARRKYQRDWYHRKMANKNSGNGVSNSSNGELINVINAYHTMYNHTNNGETKSQLNKAFAAIVVEMA